MVVRNGLWAFRTNGSNSSILRVLYTVECLCRGRNSALVLQFVEHDFEEIKDAKIRAYEMLIRIRLASGLSLVLFK